MEVRLVPCCKKTLSISSTTLDACLASFYCLILCVSWNIHCLCAREEQIQGFSDVCDGVEFIELQKLPESQGQYPRPLHKRPALHTFWTECWVSQ